MERVSRRALGSLAAVAAASAFVAAAHAKGPTAAAVCGASGCRAADPAQLNPVDGQPFGLAAAPRPAPYYVAFLSAPGEFGFCWRLLWVPSRRVLRVESMRPYVPGEPIAGRIWRSVDAALARRLARAVRGVTPFAGRLAWRSPKSRCAS